MADYKDFDLNYFDTEKPWAPRESQALEDIIDTLVGDAITVGKEVSGHLHNKVYSPVGVAGMEIGAAGDVQALSLTAAGVVTNQATGSLGTVPYLPINLGGTNSDTALDNGRVMVSDGGKIVESAITTDELALLDDMVSVSTGAGDNDKLVTQGYVDDLVVSSSFWERTSTTLNTSNVGDKVRIGIAGAADSTLDVITSSVAGSAALAADDLIIRSNEQYGAGMTIFSSNTEAASVYFGCPTYGGNAAWIEMSMAANELKIATGKVGGKMVLSTAQGTRRVEIDTNGYVTFLQIAHEATDVDKFLVSNAGEIRYRTGAELLSDIGGGGTDQNVGVDSGATAGFLGAASGDGVLRSSSPLTYTDGGDFVTLGINAGLIDHGALAGKGDDDHTQYALLAGRAGGQLLFGGTAASDSLTLASTTHTTKGFVYINSDIQQIVHKASITNNRIYNNNVGGGAQIELDATGNSAYFLHSSASSMTELAFGQNELRIRDRGSSPYIKVTPVGTPVGYSIKVSGGTPGLLSLGSHNVDDVLIINGGGTYKDVYTVPWTDYTSSSTITGYSTVATKSIRYKLIGKLAIVHVRITGTSNSNDLRFTVPWNPLMSTGFDIGCGTAQDGTSPFYVEGGCHFQGYGTGGTIQVGKSGDYNHYNNWTASGTKFIAGTLIFEIS